MAQSNTHVIQARGGDKSSKAWLYGRYGTWVVAMARHRIGRSAALRQHVDPDDIAAEAWLVALEKLPEFDVTVDHPCRAFMKFLSTTVAHRIGNRITKLAGKKPVEAPHCSTPDALRVSRELVRAELRREVLDAIENLPSDKLRNVIVLRGIEQNSVLDTAHQLDIGESDVKMTYLRGRRLLAEALGNDLRDEPLLDE